MGEKLVRTRKEGDHFYAYFPELRRATLTNQIGAIIMDLFFNRDFVEPQSITSKINQKDFNVSEQEVKSFLSKIRDEIISPSSVGVPYIEDQLLSVPFSAELQLNRTCNLRCKHCIQRYESGYSGYMDTSQAHSIMKTLSGEGVFELNLTGGEVFLRPDILDLIAVACNDYNFGTNIITNGTLVDSSDIKELVKFKDRLAVAVSLEGPERVNDEIRGEGTFRKAISSINEMQSRGLEVEVELTINSKNIDIYDQLMKSLHEKGVTVNFTLYVSKSLDDPLAVSPSDYFEFVDELAKKPNQELIGFPSAALLNQIEGEGERNECRGALSGLSINADGEMVPCPFLEDLGFYEDKQLPEFDSDFVNTWQNNDLFQSFREGNMRECQARAYGYTGDRRSQDPFGIEAYRNFKKQ